MARKKATNARTKRAAAAARPRSTEPNEDADVRQEPREPRPRQPRAAPLAREAVGAAADTALGASRRAIRATPIIVQKAASILEEEVAMGIGAAKRIEQRFLDVAALRAQSPDAVMSRFRRDAHEAVDIILDIVTAAATTVGERAGRFVNITASGRHTTTTSPAAEEPGIRLSKIRFTGAVKAGGDATVSISLENESDQQTAEFTLVAGELVSASGERIAASAVTFTPPTLSVGPRSSGQVVVRVAVPAGTRPGTYEGLVRATQLDALRALLSIEVE